MNLTALHKISYGMYIVCSKNNDKFNGQIANTVFQTTSEPPMIAVSICSQNLTHEYISTSKVFTVSILSQATPMTFIGLFGFKSGRILDKFKDTGYRFDKTGAPIVLDNSIGYLEAQVIDSLNCKTHTIFIGRVVSAEIIDTAEPMTYAYYHEVIKGKAPKTAPTYLKEEDRGMPFGLKEVKVMKKYRCIVCNYIYDPDIGDPDNDIEPGVPFADLPDDWVCPVCGADKSQFEEVS